MRKSTVVFLTLSLLWSMCAVASETPDRHQFKPCHPDNLYRIDDPILPGAGLADTPIASVRPRYEFASEAELKAFFGENVTLPDEANNVFVRVIVAFVVNCEGDFGGFQSLGDAPPWLVDPIVDACKKMPKWKAAKVDGEPVDCITKIGFTVSAGKLSARYW